MPAFQVLVNPPSLSGERGRAQTLVVTATSTLDRPSTARVSVVASPITAAAWIAPPPNVLGRFPGKNATQDFTFSFTVPPDVPAGSYSLRFDVVDTEFPDDHFGSSQTLAVLVNPPPPNGGPPPRRFPWWIPVGAVVLLLVVAFVLWRLFGGPDRMPDLVKRSYAEALETLAKLDSTRFVITHADTVADTIDFGRGVVVSQNIEPKAKLETKGNALRLTVQRSWAVVPALKSLMVDAAGIKLAGDSLLMTIARAEQPSQHPIPSDGRVLGSNPPAGTLVVRGQSVQVVVVTRVPCVPILGGCRPIPNPMAAARDNAALRANREGLQNWRH